MSPPEDLPKSGSSAGGGSIPPGPESIATTEPARLPRHANSDGGDDTSVLKAKRQVARSVQKSPDATKGNAAEPTEHVSVVARSSQKQQPSVPGTTTEKRRKGGDGQLEVRDGDGAEPPLLAGAPLGSAGLSPGAYTVSPDGDVSTAGNDPSTPNSPSTADGPSTVAAGGMAPTTSLQGQSRYDAIAEATLVPENSGRDQDRDIDEEQPIAVAVKDKPFANAMKDRRVQICLVFVALAFIGLGVGLGVGLSNNDSSGDNKTSNLERGNNIPAPSPSPTTSKQPTTSPSRSFAPTIRPWMQLGQIIDNFSRRANFGFAVSMSDDGNRLIASAPHHQKTGDGITIVRVYDYEEGKWVQVGSDLVGDAIRDGFGRSVSVSGNKERIAIGAPLVGSGHAKVFQLDQSGNWSLVGVPIVGNETGESTGKSVSLSQNASILAVGASGYVDVYKYEDTSGNWTQIGQRLEEGNITDNFGFGSSLDLSSDGGIMAIGAPHYNETGRVSVFAFQNNSWTQMGSDLYGDLVEDKFGATISLSDGGTTLAVGADEHDGPGGDDSGLVRVFKYDSDKNDWVQKGDDLVGMRKEDNFGRGLSLSGDGNIVGVGAYREDVFSDDPKDNSGRVRVYEFMGGGWEQIGDKIDALDKKDWWGYALSLSQDGSRIAIGAYRHDINRTKPTKISDTGQVVVYEWTDP